MFILKRFLGVFLFFIFFPCMGKIWEAPVRPVQKSYPNWRENFAARSLAVQEGFLFAWDSQKIPQSAWKGATYTPDDDDWRILLRDEAQLVGSQKVHLLLGDSLTFWFPQEWLPQNEKFLNLGIAGNSTSKLLMRLEDYQHLQPQWIFLLIGINDYLFPLPHLNGIEEIRNHALFQTEEMIKNLKQYFPRSHFAFISLLPTDGTKVANGNIQVHNKALEKLAQKYQSTYLNVNPWLTKEKQGLEGPQLAPHLSIDGLHLNFKGYGEYSKALERIISP